MIPEFRNFQANFEVEYRFNWPNNISMGNGFKELINTYTDNVTTNSKTHRIKRLTQFLKLKVFKVNTLSAPIIKYIPDDISNAVKFLSNMRNFRSEQTMMRLKNFDAIVWLNMFVKSAGLTWKIKTVRIQLELLVQINANVGSNAT